MSLRAIVAALGGDLYAGGRRASVPAPGHSPADRSVSLLLANGRVVAHSFGAASWQEVLADLRDRGLIDEDGAPAAGSARAWRRPVHAGAADPAPAERVRLAQALWDAGVALGEGAAAGRYCRRRGVKGDFTGLTALRSHPAAAVAVYRPGVLARPALLARVDDDAGRLTAVEVTYLDADGRRSRSLRLPRKTVGRLPPRSAVRLSPPAAELLVAEGVFSTLSAMARFAMPGWALLSTTNLRRWGPPPEVRRVLIAADRGTAGEAAAAELAARLAGHGVAATVRPPPAPYSDWNEAAQDQEEK